MAVAVCSSTVVLAEASSCCAALERSTQSVGSCPCRWVHGASACMAANRYSIAMVAAAAAELVSSTSLYYAFSGTPPGIFSTPDWPAWTVAEGCRPAHG